MEHAFENKSNDENQKKTLTRSRRLSTHRKETKALNTGGNKEIVIFYDVDQTIINPIVMPHDI